LRIILTVDKSIDAKKDNSIDYNGDVSDFIYKVIVGCRNLNKLLNESLLVRKYRLIKTRVISSSNPQKAQ